MDVGNPVPGALLQIRGLLVAVLVISGASACSSLPGPKVRAVDIVGHGAIDESDIVNGLQNHPPDGIWPFRDYASYEPLALKLDWLRIESFYKSRGFFSARVEGVEVRDAEPDLPYVVRPGPQTIVVEDVKVYYAGTDAVVIRYVVRPGPQATIAEVIATSTTSEAVHLTTGEVERWSGLKTGAPLNYDDFRAAQERLAARLIADGYAFAKVSGRIETDRQSGDSLVRLLLQPGPVVYYENTVIEGLERLPPRFVRNRLAYAPGDRFNPADLERTRLRLYDTGLVSNVVFDRIASDNPERLRVVIRGSQGRRHQIQLGAGAGFQKTRYEIRALARYQHRGFIDPLSTLSAEVRPSIGVLRATGDLTGLNVEARLTWTREDFIFPRLKYETELSYAIIEYEAYTTRGPSIALRFSRPLLDDQLSVSFTPQLSHVSIPLGDSLRLDLDEREQLRAIGIADPLTVLSFAPAITYDGRDNPVSPRRGFYARFRLELGRVFAPPANWYLIVSPELRGYVPLGRRLTLAGRIKAATGLLKLRPLPITQRFFAGGADSQRGFGRRQLAPSRPAKEGDDLPVGGEAIVEAGVEARLFLFSWNDLGFRVVGFFDGADVSNNLTDFDLTRLHWAAGSGLRVDTLIGVFRFDVGFRLNRTGPDEPDPNSTWAFHLTFGEAF